MYIDVSIAQRPVRNVNILQRAACLVDLRQAHAIDKGLGKQEHNALHDERVLSVQELVYLEATSIQRCNNAFVSKNSKRFKIDSKST